MGGISAAGHQIASSFKASGDPQAVCYFVISVTFIGVSGNTPSGIAPDA